MSSIRSIFILFVFILLQINIHGQVIPVMPQEWLDGCLPTTPNEITVCAAGCDYTNSQLQQAINQALPGTTIRLESGATYVGPFNLPEKFGEGWIVIRTDVPDDQLPPLNSRIDPSYAPVLAKIEAKPTLSAITTSSRAHHYAFFGVEFRTQGFSWNVITIGNGESLLADLPDQFLFDRIYLHGHPTLGSRRGIAMNGRRIAVVNSWIDNFKEEGADSQALCAWNGTTFKIVNNRLEGAGENIMFGGAITNVPDMLMADIEFRNNHVIKPLAWKADHPDYEGTDWSMKNLFELKNATRVWVRGNVFEQNWADSQTGFAILFTPRTEGGACPWITVSDVTFEHNIIRHTGSGFNIAARDNSLPTIPTARIWIHNNLIEDINGNIWGGDGRSLQILSGVEDLSVDHNTFINPYGNTFVNADGISFPNTNFRYTNNITSHGVYGLHGSGKGVGNGSLTSYFPGAVVEKNVIANGINTTANPSNYPMGNFFPGQMTNIGFVNYNNGIGGDYTLLSSSPYIGVGTDGRDPGVAIDTLNGITDPVFSGVFPICENTTSISDVHRAGDIPLILVPNPGTDRVRVSVAKTHFPGPDQIRILDLYGRRWSPDRITYSGSECEILMSGLPDGVYIIQIQAGYQLRSSFWIKQSGY